MMYDCFQYASWGNVLVHNAQPPPPPPPPTNAPPDPKPLPPPPPDETPSNSIGITEEEKSFDIQFKEWEDKFQLWKEENKNHPDKVIVILCPSFRIFCNIFQ